MAATRLAMCPLTSTAGTVPQLILQDAATALQARFTVSPQRTSGSRSISWQRHMHFSQPAATLLNLICRWQASLPWLDVTSE